MSISIIYKKFPTEDKFIKHLEGVLWEGEPKCPYCNSTYQTPAPKERRYHCNNCNTSYGVTTKTVFHKTRVDLRKWLYVIEALLKNEKLPVRKLGEILGVTKDTAAFLVNRIEEGIRLNESLFNKIAKY